MNFIRELLNRRSDKKQVYSNSPEKQEYDAYNLPRYFYISNNWYDLKSISDVEKLPVSKIEGQISGKTYNMDKILFKKAELHFTNYETELRTALLNKATEIIKSGKGSMTESELNSKLLSSNDDIALVFKHGLLIAIQPALTNDTNYYNAYKYIIDTVTYNLNSINDINKIPNPVYMENKDPFPSITQHLDYILRMKASHFRGLDKKELSYACLKKAIILMKSSLIDWQAKDYLRIVHWLIEDGLFDEAKKEENELKKSLPALFSHDYSSRIQVKNVLEQCNDFKTDLVEMSFHYSCCGECAKYRGRVYSITGKDKKYPQLPNHAKQFGKIHEGCKCTFHPYIHGVSIPMISSVNDIIKYSNKPFIDDRTDVEISNYEQSTPLLNDENQKEIDRVEYYKIVYMIPDLAPKSFGAYRRMKKMNSANYTAILEKAKQYGIDTDY